VMRPWDKTFLCRLEQSAEIQMPGIHKAWDRSQEILARVREAVHSEVPEELSLVAFGSLARMEYTAGSDLDWCLLVDGRADADHRRVQLRVQELLRGVQGIKDPNPTGAFGGLVFSHELIHCVGGTQDTNANLTRRLLLLIESVELNKPAIDRPRSRLLRGILQRYFEEETRFPGKKFFPRFFMNDVVRFWRTMAVDFAAKTHERGPRSWALRNVKLRFSRKLLFVAGMLLSYETTLFPESKLLPLDEQSVLRFDEMQPEFSSTEHCFRAAALTPLELLARVCVSLKIDHTAVEKVFSAYNAFLEVLADAELRNVLSELDFQNATELGSFQRVRDLGHEFQTGLDKIFFEAKEMREPTLRYGVF
jgi:predicted nucleotidyltransferase